MHDRPYPAAAPPRGVAPIGFEAVPINCLGRLDRGVAALLAPSTTAVANMMPGRQLQTQTGMLGRIDKRFDQPRATAVLRFYVGAQTPQQTPEYMRRQIAAVNAEADQKTIQLDNTMQPFAALGAIPAVPVIAQRQPQSRCIDAGRPQPAMMTRVDEVTQLAPDQRPDAT